MVFAIPFIAAPTFWGQAYIPSPPSFDKQCYFAYQTRSVPFRFVRWLLSFVVGGGGGGGVSGVPQAVWDVFMAFFIVFSVVEVTFRLGFDAPAEGR